MAGQSLNALSSTGVPYSIFEKRRRRMAGLAQYCSFKPFVVILSNHQLRNPRKLASIKPIKAELIGA
jgi:hypothetical protein